MTKKVNCKVETDENLISGAGYSLLQKLKKLNMVNYIFKAEIDEEKNSIKIYLPKSIPIETHYQDVGKYIWHSSYTYTVKKTKRMYSFIIIENKQLEFDF